MFIPLEVSPGEELWCDDCEETHKIIRIADEPDLLAYKCAEGYRIVAYKGVLLPVSEDDN